MKERKLHLGAGDEIKEGWINLDIRDLPGIDVVRDVLTGLPFDDDSIDFILSINFLEHLPQDKAIWFMNEQWRVMKVGGMIQHLVPKAGTLSFFQDPTHLSRWTNDTVKYFTKDHELWKLYKDYIKPWKMIKNQTSHIGKDFVEFILEKV